MYRHLGYIHRRTEARSVVDEKHAAAVATHDEPIARDERPRASEPVIASTPTIGWQTGRSSMARKKVSTTVYIEPEQAERLKVLHERTKVPVAVYIREGIELALAKYEHLLP